MADTYSLQGDPSEPMPSGARPIVIHNNFPRQPWLGSAFLKTGLILSILANIVLVGLMAKYGPSTPGEQFREGDIAAKEKIALIPVRGIIFSETVQAPIRELKEAAEDDAVKAIILLIESPGGTISGSDELYHEIEKFKEKTKKPIVACMRGLAASGGYYIAMPADKIFADRSCITGSIGVIASMFNFEKLMKDWGVKSEVIKSGKMKDSGSPTRAMTEEERAEWQSSINKMYEQFLSVILKYRKDKIVGGEAGLRKLADGRTYMAPDAKASGLIDELGFLEDAISAAKKLANIGEKARVISYDRPGNLLTSLLGIEGKADQQLDAKLLLKLATPRIWLLPSAYLPMVD